MLFIRFSHSRNHNWRCNDIGQNSSIYIRVVKWALKGASAFEFLAELGLIEKGVVFLFFPAVSSHASWLQNAPLLIFANECPTLPIRTKIESIVVKKLRFPSKVLPVVCIITLCLVVFLVEWAPFSLKVKHVKVKVFFHVVNDSSFNFSLRMSKWTKIAIFAIYQLLRKFSAEFGLILFNVIQSFNSIVR